MNSLTVNSSAGNYHVVIGRGLVNRLSEFLDEYDLEMPHSIITNTTVAEFYGHDLSTSLGIKTPYELPDGEQYKRWPQVEALCLEWLTRGLSRRDSVIAIGGGVVTDTLGFAAAVFMRGIPWIAVPTTLLAMVDASVGGKTGINLDTGKNLVGAFWPPRLVVADIETLSTLPERELRAGLAEAVKTSWIGDPSLLELVEACGRTYRAERAASWVDLVTGCVHIKADIVIKDEYESGARKKLNLGHSLGHALEAATSYRRFLHGEAVTWGLRAVAEISRGRDLLDHDHYEILMKSLRMLEPLPAIDDLSLETIGEHLVHDKKRDDLGIAWVLPANDGVLLDQRVEHDELRRVFEKLKNLPPGLH